VLALSASGFAAKICIDPGHGGSDPGAAYADLEKVNVLNTGLKFRNWLNTDTNDSRGGGSWVVIMTRSTDVYVGLSARADFANANGADRFMSLHNNACGNCGGTGTTTYSYLSPNATTADLRNRVQQRTVEAWGLRDRGNATANFAVLRETVMPAELCELGFIDNSGDAALLRDSAQQDKVTRYHLYAIQNHFGIGAYTPSTSTAVTYTNDAPVVSAGWSTGSSATDKYGADYKFKATTAVSDPASWSISVSAGGSYNIYAWWPAGTNRSTTAPFILPNGATTSQNQQINGGKFNLLGTVSLAAGANTTKLSCWTTSGFVVVADAVRYVGPN
jgi:N-acetylmuramoyl-L-alanine amidase